ncbi:MAG TPA: thioredoxin-dependent thiol peroxidase [Acidobacteriota bacterium]|nr:thioredoxin-dependent thiol peroxidase [Acidobacteriota bacterium]
MSTSDNQIPAAGTGAPDFTLPGQDGADVSLTDFTGKWVVLYFYPKDDTPGCTTEACDFTAGIKAFEKLNAVVLGVSPDSVASHQKFTAKHKLDLTLLSDEDKSVLRKYGAWRLKKIYGKEMMGVARSTFLIRPDGTIAYVWSDVQAAGHADEVKEKLAELSQ